VSDTASLARLLKSARPERGLIAAGVLIAILDVGANLLFPILTRNIIDSMSVRPVGFSDARILVLMGVVLLGGMASGVAGYMLAYAAQRIGVRLKNRLFASVLRKPIELFDRRESGDLVSRITNDTTTLTLLCTKSLSGLTNGLLLLLGSAIILFFLDPWLTGAIFGIIGGAFVIMAPSFLKITAITKDVNDSRAEANANIARVLGQIRLVKAANAEAFESRKISQYLDEGLLHAKRSARVEALLTPLNGLALTGAIVMIFTYGAARVHTGAMTIGTLTVFILYIFNVVAPLIQISTFISQLQTARGSSAQLCELLDEPGEQAGPAKPYTVHDHAGEGICLQDIEFAYPTRPGVVLKIQRLDFPANSCTAIIGESGAGKTTLIELIERFYPLEVGQITCNGKNITSFELNEWRSRIGYVAQDAPLMKGTIADNIAYGDKGPVDRSRLCSAATSANCMDFINSLSEGFETRIGEAGILLSAGQKQRIALARAFYLDPEILLFDEATANLDDANETAVLQSIARLVKGRTSIIITHRSATLEYVDRVVLLERGAVSAVFSPEQAMAHRALLKTTLDAA
jgi:ATP-binding cassette subfamily B protein AbcA/BmrA